MPVRFQNKNGWIVLDQIRAVDKRRLIRKLGSLNQKTVRRIKAVIKEMLVD
ncbi:MAG: type II toxin-antitoxin system PemK/MazF family toxin [Acidobacteria bacterium]|nr:type II toxin-antitoxin system PemK/MazF family toxin [Acidobacteriota bacterium]